MRRHVKLRHEKIIDLLSAERTIPISNLLDLLNVSTETLRKDLIILENRGMVRRQHGSVTLVSYAGDDKIDVRKFSEIPAKRRIAEAALEYVPSNPASIILDSGNTVWFFSKLLTDLEGYTIVTNSIETAHVLADFKGSNTVYCSGGAVRPVDYGMYGRFALNCVKSMTYSVCFLGTAGVKNSKGLGAISFDDRDLKQAMLAQSDFCVALLDSTKFDKIVLLDAIPWESVDVVITDSGISDSDKKMLEKKTKLMVV